MSEIAISAILEAKDGLQNKVLEVLLELAKHSKKEEGCLQYNLHQSSEHKNLFLLYEVYKNQEAAEKHGQTPHYLSYRTNIEPLVVSRSVQKWTPIKA